MNQALVDYLSRFVTEHKQALVEKNLRYRTRHLAVVLEDLYQPHNTSACLRSCDCFGVQDVHIIEQTNRFRINRDVTLGAAQWLTLFRYQKHENNTLRCIETLRERGYRIVVTSPSEEGCSLEDYDVRQRTALLFGNEHRGVSEIAMENADGLLRIPIFGFTKSLNISVAVAVCLQHLTARLRDSDVDWRLSETEARDVKREWMQAIVRKKFKHDIRNSTQY